MKKIKDNEHLILIILGILFLAYDYSKTNTFESYGMLLIGLGLMIIWGKRVFKKRNKYYLTLFWLISFGKKLISKNPPLALSSETI